MTNPQGFPAPGGPPSYGPPGQQFPPPHQFPPPQQTAPQQARPPKKKALPIIIIGALVLALIVGGLLFRASRVVGPDDYGKAELALVNLRLHLDQNHSAIEAATGTGEVPADAADQLNARVEGLRADLAAVQDSGAVKDEEFAALVDPIGPALDGYAARVDQFAGSLAPIQQMKAACSDYLSAHPLIEDDATEAKVAQDIAECEQATTDAASTPDQKGLQAAYADWIASQKSTATAYEDYRASRDLTAYERALDVEATGNKAFEQASTQAQQAVADELNQVEQPLRQAAEGARSKASAGKNGD